MIAEILALCSLEAPAEISGLRGGSDTLLMREAEGVAAEIVYGNGVRLGSMPGHFPLAWNGIAVVVEIIISPPDGAPGVERAIVTVCDPGLLAIPAEIDVTDGETGVVQIMTPIF